jgi:hypothetical protein
MAASCFFISDYESLQIIDAGMVQTQINVIPNPEYLMFIVISEASLNNK